jgi:steroid delta-isomerase-like uncharacterized protein
MTLSEKELLHVAQRWTDVMNTGTVDDLEEIVDYDVVDHSGLTKPYGGGCDGFKHLVEQLRTTFPDYRSTLESVDIDGDVVTLHHNGTASAPQTMAGLTGQPPDAATGKPMSFTVTSAIRVSDAGKVVEHWAVSGPFGEQSTPGAGTGTDTGTGLQTGTPELNKAYMRQYVKNVIDAQQADNGRFYFSENFYNHDPAPGEQPGREGAIAFIKSIFSAFSGFRTVLEEQVAEDDLVAGRWSQQFKNTGSYLGFPASGRDIHIGGITITRVRSGRIVEEWEARDALSLLGQMGIPSPLGDLEGGAPASDDEADKETARRFYYDVWDQEHLDSITSLFARDFTEHSPVPGQQPGTAGVAQLVRAFHTAFPDLSVSVDLQVSAGGRVATRFTVRGTHRGVFRGAAPTGKRIEVTGIDVHAVSNGLITDHWGFFDNASLVTQLGLIEFPPGIGAPPSGGTPGTPSTPGTSEPPTTPSPWDTGTGDQPQDGVSW